MNVLVVEDDEIILEGIKYALTQEGYQVLSAMSVAEAMDWIHGSTQVEFCLFDVMLPDGNGFDICLEMRKTSKVPIIFLTACDDEVSTVRALELGADDYIAKPFRIRELMARMKAVLRRYEGSAQTENVVSIGGNLVNLQTAKVYRNQEEIVLTAMEYKLLLVFIQNRGQIIPRNRILDLLWDDVGDFVNDNTLTVYIKRLRKKLEDTDETNLIQTIRGMGYRLNEADKM